MDKYRFFRLTIISSLIFSMLAYACVKEEYNFDKISSEMEFDIGLAVPLAYGEAKLQQILPTDSGATDFYYIDSENFLPYSII